MNPLRRTWKWILEEDLPAWGWITIGAVTLFIITMKSGKAFDGGPNSTLLALSILGGVAGYGAYKRYRWGLLLGLGFLGVLLACSVYFLILNRPSILRVFGVLSCAWVLWDVWRELRHPRQLDTSASSQEPDQPMVSLVLLLKEPQHLDATILAKVASKAWDADVKTIEQSDDDDSELSFVGGDSPHFICSHGGGFFAIHNFDRPYFEDVEQIATAVTELRRQKAIREHTAWISCDLIRWLEPGDDLSQAYRLIARLLCELLDDNCLAIVDPKAQQVFLNDPETESKLRSPDPRTALQESYYVPVIAVAPDDPRMLAAVAEARGRWEEFVTTFEKREDSGNEFFVKSPFSENDVTEFMWLKVEALENGRIFGVLGNDPNELPSLREGSRVTAKAEELNDWIIQPPTGDFIGGFTIHVLSEQVDEENGDRDPME